MNAMPALLHCCRKIPVLGGGGVCLCNTGTLCSCLDGNHSKQMIECLKTYFEVGGSLKIGVSDL